MIPELVKEFFLKHKEGTGYFYLEISASNLIIDTYGDPNIFGINAPQKNMQLTQYLPVLLSEKLDSDFEIPFFNITEDHVCHIYFFKKEKLSYVLLIDKSEIYKATKKYQQFAHEDNISKNKFKRIANKLKKTQKQLKKSNQEKSTLIAMLSHELGTPLTSIIGYSELLLGSKSHHKNELEIIHRNAVYLKHMIENTLLFGKSEAGGLSIQIESISVQNLFNGIKAILLPSAQNKNLALHMFHKGNELINIDITRTKQILINLLNNAVKYTESGSIELKFSHIKEHYVFSIIDTGLGIAKEMQSTIFSPWERIEENSESGSGIGLFISQKLAHAMDGEVKLKYSSKEYGSIFQLVIPENHNNVRKSATKENKISQCVGKSLLVIDDDFDILELIKAFLSSSGLKLFTATNFKKAQELLKTHSIDIVLSDYHLGKERAINFIEPFKNTYPQIPIILMTAMPSSAKKHAFKSLGFTEVISKPLDGTALLKVVVENIKH